MRITFLNPPFLPRYSRAQRSPGVIKSGALYYPYWLAHAAALCESKGHVIDLCDAPASGVDREATLARIRAFDPGLVIVDTSTPSIYTDIEIAGAIKAVLPHAFVALCGTHASAKADEALGGTLLSGVLLGEYDMTALELADALDSGTSPESVAGLHLADGTVTAARAMIEDLDALPWIAPIYNRFLNIDHYYFSLASAPMVMLISGRGCPNQCFFCLYPQVMHGRRYRTRSPEHLVDEVEYVIKAMPRVREIVFEDDTFTADQERTKRFCDLMLERGLQIPWFANVRVDTRPDTLAYMKRAGFRSCAVGFETGAEELLGNMRKGITIDKAKAFMAEAKRLDILVHGCFMVGFPGETRKTIWDTLNYAIELEPDSAQFYPVFPYPGTEAYRWAEENSYLRTTDFRRWLSEEGGHACVIDLPGLPAEELQQFCEQAYRDFHFRPRYLARKLLQAFRKPSEGWRSFRSFLNYLRSLAKGIAG